MPLDIKALSADLARSVAGHIRPLMARVKALEERVPERGEKGERGERGEMGPAGADAPAVDTAAISMLVASSPTLAALVDKAVEERLKANPPPPGRDGSNGAPGQDGAPGADGQKGADGLGLAGAMIDRDGALVLTMTNGETKNLGVVVGKDGADGLSLESFDLEYLDESHEIRIKASAAGRVKEVRFPAGGLRPGGYWREGTKAQAGEAWVHDGSTYIAKHPTTSKPDAKSEDWIIAARRGRDGERGQKGADGSPPAPIKLNG